MTRARKLFPARGRCIVYDSYELGVGYVCFVGVISRKDIEFMIGPILDPLRGRRRCTWGVALVFIMAATWSLTGKHASGAENTAAFGMNTVVDLARKLSGTAYESPDGKVPDFLRTLDRSQWESIAFSPSLALWQDDRLPFEVAFHHPGYIFTSAVLINVVENGQSRPILFSPEQFTYPTAELKEQVGKANIGYAGLCIRHIVDGEYGPTEQRDWEEIASFLGASFFRSHGRQSSYGSYARGLAVDTALPDGEEFPYFREFWLEKPAADSQALSLYALLDSPRMTGAFHFTIAPGVSTVMDVEATVFSRHGTKQPLKVGLAPLTSMFLHSETANGRPDDYRPEVHNADGLLCATSAGEWLWRPLANPGRLAVNRIAMENPKGFGLFQRDDNFDHYQDLEARFDRRASIWVEPKGEWGAGHVELIEIPGTEEHQANVVAFWVPEPKPEPVQQPVDAGKPAGNGQSAGVALSYRLYWMTPGVSPHNLGRVVATRTAKPAGAGTLQFLIDFEGEQLNALQADTGLTSVVEAPEQFPVVEKKLVKNPMTSGWRLVLTVRLPAREGILNTLFSSRDGSGAVRFKALLKQGENLPDALTEAWVFDLQP